MKTFHSYEKVERLEKSECDGILAGTCAVFEKLDGANAQISWDEKNEEICFFSRNRLLGHITKESKLTECDEFRGFAKWVMEHFDALKSYFLSYPNVTLMGEWLVKHSISYGDEYWNNFYIFDIYNRATNTYIPYVLSGIMPDVWNDLMSLQFTLIPCDDVLYNPTKEMLQEYLKSPSMCKSAIREGIVIKNYSFINKYGRTPYAKLLSTHFNEVKTKKQAIQLAPDAIELAIVDKYCTYYRVEKLCNKIKTNDSIELEMSHIPRVINTVWYDIITEDMNDILKKFKDPTINFKVLKKLVFEKAKEYYITLLERNNG
jgi:hypothetical protein